MIDNGSSVELVGILSQYCNCISIDIRPLMAKVDGLSGCLASVLQLPFANDSIPFLTSMCVLEHIGLGRYGDKLNPNGTDKAVHEISRVITPGGIVVYSVPIGRFITEFNAHRRFTYEKASILFTDWDLIDSVALIPYPTSFSSNDDLMNTYNDPVGCFYVPKPKSD